MTDEGTMVKCVRCERDVLEKEADFSADGLLCKNCVLGVDVAKHLGVATVSSADATSIAETGFVRSQAIRHLTIGVIGVVAGLVILGFMLWAASNGVASRALVIPIALLIGGFAEVARGAAAWSSLKSIGRRPLGR